MEVPFNFFASQCQGAGTLWPTTALRFQGNLEARGAWFSRAGVYFLRGMGSMNIFLKNVTCRTKLRFPDPERLMSIPD